MTELEKYYKNKGVKPVIDEGKVDLMYIDVTIVDLDTDDSIVLKCKDFVKARIKDNPALQPVCLVLKKMLKKFDLNQPYTGGLGSYSLFLMLLFVSNFTKYLFNNIRYEIYVAKLLIYFLSYYGNFDPSTNVICSYEAQNFNLVQN